MKGDNMEYRIEKDLLGEKEVPAGAYWGVHTERARENFVLSGQKVNPRLVKSMALVKTACAGANAELGYLDARRADAIVSAALEIAGGELLDEFPLDALQGGAGTSTNMNVNEVIANRAAEKLGFSRGDHSAIHPIEHVNMHQSTNDVYPTAVKVAAITGLRELCRVIEALQGALQLKEKEFAHVVKVGRTELQEAVPMTLGAEFSGFAEAVARDRWRTFKCEERLKVVNIGGTAVGTGLAAPRKYIFLVAEKLKEATGLNLARFENGVDQTANADVFVEASGILKAHASNLIKISNDLRMLNMLGEIALPPVQAGSSIMPGKVNPVIAEAVIQAGLKVTANDLLVTESASRGTFQIDEFMPLLAHAFLESIDLLIGAGKMLASYVSGTEARPEVCGNHLDRSWAALPALIPFIGYEKATELAREYQASGERDLKVFLARKIGVDVLAKALSKDYITALGYREDAGK